MSLDLFNLDGRRALITGSSRGIGHTLAKGLAAAGATVVLNGRDAGTLAKAAAPLLEAGHSVHQAAFDVTDAAAAAREIEQIRKSVGLQKQGVEVAQQQHRLATLRYQRGLASNFDVVDAEGSLVLARSALVSLLTRYQIARVELLRVTGSLDVVHEFRP